jgi:hypothetical protein
MGRDGNGQVNLGDLHGDSDSGLANSEKLDPLRHGHLKGLLCTQEILHIGGLHSRSTQVGPGGPDDIFWRDDFIFGCHY